MFLCKFLKEQAEYIAFLVAIFKCNAVSLRHSLCFFIGMYFSEINAGIFLYRVNHCNSFKRLAEIHFNAVICYLGRPENRLCNVTIEIFGKFHHTVVIRICLIKLHERKFRIVACVKTFIAEHSSYLVNLFKSSDDKSLQIKLKRYAELKILVKSIEMRFKRSCRSTAGIRNKHRGFNLHKSERIEILSYRAYYL